MQPRNIALFLSSVALPEAVGGIAGLATSQGVRDWYPALRKPFFNPPSWIFAPVWTALYFLMGCGLYLALRAPSSPARSRALLAFAFQLALNGAWSFLFFAFRRTGWALAEVCLLWISILLMILTLRKVRPAAAYAQIPYLAWVSYAGALNAALWRLNPSS
jgi:benzodiazapine receptor